MQKSGRLTDIVKNPQLFLDLATNTIKRVMSEFLVDGIKYEKIGNDIYEMRLFEIEELETYLDELKFKVKYKEKTIYDEYIPLDSSVESQFAKDCETNEQVEFYFKLPNWFKIPTQLAITIPIGLWS